MQTHIEKAVDHEYGEHHHLGITEYVKGIFGNAPSRVVYPELFDLAGGRKWSTLSLYLLKDEELTGFYGACFSTRYKNLEPSWVIEGTPGHPAFGYLFDTPITEDQWDQLDEALSTAPLPEHRGAYARLFKWQPDLRYSFWELTSALPSRAVA